MHNNIFEYEIISGIELIDIQDYFYKICQRQEDKLKFYGIGWVVELEDRGYRWLGSLRIPIISILFSGEEKACIKEIEGYRMKFLTAGG